MSCSERASIAVAEEILARVVIMYWLMPEGGRERKRERERRGGGI